MEVHRELGNTVVMITHDVDKAVLLSDRIVMMSNGPEAAYNRTMLSPFLAGDMDEVAYNIVMYLPKQLAMNHDHLSPGL